ADDAASASINLAQRAADMASVFNVDVSDAMEAIQAGLRGEMDPLERFGVGLSEAAVKAHAMEMGLGGAGRELTAHEKAQARLSLLMAQTDRIAGDFAATSGEVANQERIAKAEAENMAAAFGQKLIPIKAKAIEVASGLLDRFSALSPGMQDLILRAITMAAVLGPLVTVIGGVAKGIGAVSKAALFLAANPIVLLILGLVALGVAIYVFRDEIIGAIGAAIGWLKRNWPLILAILTGPFGLAVLAIVKHWDTIWRNTSGVVNTVIGFLRRNWPLILAILTGPLGLVVLAVVRNWDTIRRNTVAIFGAVVGFFQALPGRIAGALGWVINGVWGIFRSMGQNAISIVRWGVDNVLWFFANVPYWIWQRLKNLWRLLYDIGKNIFDNFLSGMKNAWNKATGWLGGIGGKIASLKGPERDDARLLRPHGAAIIEGLISGLERKLPDLYSTLGGIGADINAGVAADIDARVAVPPPGDPVRLILDFAGADTEIGRALAKMVRIEGRGDVQVAFGG
ncbi:MAG: hypothetical protein ACREKH_07300, partial [Candidatus Rokuibacteriota bacterium]